MRPGHPARSADGPDDLVPADTLAFLHADLGEMTIHGHQARSMVQQHRVAVKEVIARINDYSVSGRVHWRAQCSRDVHPAVRIAGGAIKITAQAKGARALSGDRRVQAKRRWRNGRKARQRRVNAFVLALDALKIRT